MSTQRIKAFTLIELLVVIAIIIALSAALLTAFGSARTSSSRFECAVKLRNLYGHTQTYMIDNMGKIPYGKWSESVSQQRSWDDLLLPYVDPNISPNDADATISDSDTLAFLCPDDEASGSASPNYTGRTYTMPRTRQPGGDLGIAAVSPSQGFSPDPPPQYRMSQIQQPSEVMLLTERLFGGRNILGNSGMAIIDRPDEHYMFTEVRLHPPQINYLLLDGHVESLLPEETIGQGTMAVPGGLWTRDAGD